jgi:long-chain acyl-CoA synthetase
MVGNDDGFLYLTDRATFMIVSGGVNIYPQECENLLITHRKVADAAVFGVAQRRSGRRGKGRRAADARRRHRFHTRQRINRFLHETPVASEMSTFDRFSQPNFPACLPATSICACCATVIGEIERSEYLKQSRIQELLAVRPNDPFPSP